MKKIIVGTNHSGYPELRNFINLPLKKYTIKKTFDYCKVLDYIYFKSFNKTHHFYHYNHIDFMLPFKPDLYHFFNTFSYSQKPWIVTHEAALPRFGINKESSLKLLAGKSCKKIISFCENSKKLLEFSIKDFPQFKEQILAKNIVIQPAQELYIKDVSEKKMNEKITFTFTGTDFFRKGGYETLKVFDKLIKKGAKIHLNIISKLAYNTGWKDDRITEINYLEVLNIISKNKDNITHYKGLPNNKVIEILKKSDIGILPSYGETYGYTVLEAQACGCPVITTNMPPFEEFNTKKNGWLVDVPLIDYKGSKTSNVYTEKGLKEFTETLEANLYKTIENIINNKELIYKKAKNAIKNIKENHNPETVAKKIESIYDKALVP